jgi:hypothetical protein
MLNYGLAGRSKNVLFNLHLIAVLIATKIEYKKKINIFYSDPVPDLRPDLESVWIFCFPYMFGFQKKNKNLGWVAGKCDLVKKIGNIKSCTSLAPEFLVTLLNLVPNLALNLVLNLVIQD